MPPSTGAMTGLVVFYNFFIYHYFLKLIVINFTVYFIIPSTRLIVCNFGEI